MHIKIQHQTTVDHRDQLSNTSTSTVLGSVEASGMKHVLAVLNLLLSHMGLLVHLVAMLHACLNPIAGQLLAMFVV